MANTKKILSNSTISVDKAASISNTLTSSQNSISSFTNTQSTSFVDNITSTTTTAVQDPIAKVLNKALGKIANTTTLAQKKVDDLYSQLTNYTSQNTRIQLINNTIVITVDKADAAQAEVEKSNIESKINSVRTTLGILNTTIDSLNSISQIINIILTALTIQEALLGIAGIPKIVMGVLKQAIKVIFLKDMLNTYTGVVQAQISQATTEFQKLESKFMGLQVSLNIQENFNQGNSISVDQALSNVQQNLMGSENVDQLSNEYAPGGPGSKTYIFRVEKFDDKQLIGRAYEKISGLIAAATDPSYISTPDELYGELKSIINIQAIS